MKKKSWYQRLEEFRGYQIITLILLGGFILMLILIFTGVIKKPSSLRGLFSSAYMSLSQDVTDNRKLPTLKRVNWTVQILVLDKIDGKDKVKTPMTEAVDFIKKNSKIDIVYSVTESATSHTFTQYSCGAPTSCVVVNYTDIPFPVINRLPTADSYAIFWNSAGNPPLQAGSTWGVADGIVRDGIGRPYATIPVDLWWYNNSPHEGFNSRAASIIAHELVNIINAKLSVIPYNCSPLTGTDGLPSYKFEASRLAKLTDECLSKLTATKTR